MNFTGMANKQRPKSDSSTSAKIIAFYRGRVLLLKNKDKTYELPGGHIKIGEPTIVGAKREFKEETGLDVTRLKSMLYAPTRKIYTGFLTTSRVTISDEHIGYIFVSLNKLKKYNLNKKAKNDLRYFLNKKEKIKNNDEFSDILPDSSGS
tara:strand:- start:52 stop:501 length:450 start_codon:yes stop_codon:yes gene_type:complete